MKVFSLLSLVLLLLGNEKAWSHGLSYPMPTEEEMQSRHLLCFDADSRMDIERTQKGYLASWYNMNLDSESPFDKLEERLKTILGEGEVIAIRIAFPHCAERINEKKTYNYCTGNVGQVTSVEALLLTEVNDEHHEEWKTIPIEHAELRTQKIDSISYLPEKVTLKENGSLQVTFDLTLPPNLWGQWAQSWRFSDELSIQDPRFCAAN